MKVSILIPVYGVERYIEQCCRSLFSQTYDDIEYIFVDDCSPDRSMDIVRKVLEQYPEREPRVRLLCHDRNRGLGAARQTGVEAADGEFLAFVDSDDYLPEDAIECLVRRQEETNADIVCGSAAYVTDTSLVEHKPFKGTDSQHLRLMLCQNVVNGAVWARLYRRRLFRSNGVGFVEGVNYAEDQCIVPRLMFYGRRAWTDHIVYYYRDAVDGSYTNQQMSDRNKRSYLRAMGVVNRFFTEKDSERKYRRPLEIGMSGVYRECRRMGLPFSEADATVGFHAETAVGRLLMLLMRSRTPFSLADAIYRIVRRLYIFEVMGPRTPL